MASKPGMRGRDRKVFDNLEAVEVQFLSPRCQDDAHAPRLRLTLNVVKRARKAVTRNPPAHPAEQSCAGVGTRTHYGIVVMNNKPTWIIGLAQKGMGKGWTRRPVIQRASRSTPANRATLHTTPNSFQERSNACPALPPPSAPTLSGSRCPPHARPVWDGLRSQRLWESQGIC